MLFKLCDWIFSFNQFLYFGVRSGYIYVIKYLFLFGVVDSCVFCLNFIYWILKDKVRLFMYVFVFNLLYECDYKKYILKDDRCLFFCEFVLDIVV